ncbi:glycosyltransferase family 2 protein, partial [Phocaeicola dorei]
MLSEIIHIMEYTLYIYLSVSVGYIVLFSAASHFFKQKKYPATTVRQRFIILVPAYKEDAVIHACVTSVLRQTYPAELYDLIVISDHMRPETNALLRKERISLIELHEKESSKAKA